MVRLLLWIFASIAMLAIAMHVAVTYEASDRMTGLFLRWQSLLPIDLSLEQFLIIIMIFSIFSGLSALSAIETCAIFQAQHGMTRQVFGRLDGLDVF